MDEDIRRIFLQSWTKAISGQENHSLAPEDNDDYIGRLRKVVDSQLDGHLLNLADQQNVTLELLPILESNRTPDREKEFIKVLANNINKVQNGENGGITPRISRDLNGMDCSMSTWVMVHEARKMGINIEFGAPVGHAVGIVTLANGEILYADGQNGFVEKIEAEVRLISDKARIIKINNYAEIQARQPRFFPEYVLVGENVDLASTLSNIDSMLYKQYVGDGIKEKFGKDAKIVDQMQIYAKEFQVAMKDVSSDGEKRVLNEIASELFPETDKFRNSEEVKKDIKRRGL